MSFNNLTSGAGGRVSPRSYRENATFPTPNAKASESLAQRTGRSKTDYIREASVEHLDDLEDVYLAEQVLERVRRGEESVFSLEDVERRLGLEN